MVRVDDLEIQGLRGIKSGKLSGFAPLTVLVGPNSSGKSTVLEALLLARNPEPHQSARTVALRRWSQRTADRNGAPTWLFHDAAAGIRVTAQIEGKTRTINLSLKEDGQVWAGVSGSAYQAVDLSRANGGPLRASDGAVEIIEPFVPGQGGLEELWTTVVRAGRREEVESSLKSFIPNLERLELLIGDKGAELNVSLRDARPAALPVRVAGDGIQALLRAALVLSPQTDDLILAEEPETFKHPRALWETARIFVRALCRGNQVVIATHSLEFIDMLTTEIEEQNVGTLEDTLAVMRLALRDGELLSSVLRGDDVRATREALQEDLR